MATMKDLEERREVARAAADAVRPALDGAGADMGDAFGEGLRSGIREAEYRLLTDAEARAQILGDGSALGGEDARIFGEVLAEHAGAMAEIDRNFAANALTEARS